MKGFFDQPHNKLELLGLQAGLDAFVTTCMPARNYAPRTRKEYQADIADLVAFLAKQGISSWTVVVLRDLQRYFAELDYRDLKASSRHRKTYAIKTFFRFLRQSGYIREDPSRELIPPTPAHNEPRFLREDEYQLLRDQVQDVRDLAIIELFLQVGLRISELASLTLADVQLPEQMSQSPEDTGFLQVCRRGQRVATLPLNRKACIALSAWLKAREGIIRDKPVATNAIFLSRVKKPLTVRAIRNLVQKYLKQAGIQGASVHTLRHTMATHYLARGGDVKSVQGMLGLESAKNMDMYLEMAKKAQFKMVQTLEL